MGTSKTEWSDSGARNSRETDTLAASQTKQAFLGKAGHFQQREPAKRRFPGHERLGHDMGEVIRFAHFPAGAYSLFIIERGEAPLIVAVR
jgi:hypothetical protein